MKILSKAGFSKVISKLPSLTVAPGVTVGVGPARRQIASYKSVKVSWDNVKFLLSFEGSIEEVIEALRLIEKSFEEYGYPLEKVCHYYEITFPEQPIDVDNFVKKLRRSVNLSLSLNDERLKPFSISLSNFEEPISGQNFYKWLHVSISPDVNTPNKRVVLSIIKRDVELKSVIEFLQNISKLINYIKSAWEGGELS